VNEVMSLNGIPSKLEENLKIINDISEPDTEPHYPPGWGYKPPYRFTGKIDRVDIELGPMNLSPEDETKLHEMQTAFAGSHE